MDTRLILGRVPPCMASLWAVVRLAALVALLVLCRAAALSAEDTKPPPCIEDAMIVFDASGSMAGSVDQGKTTKKPRIDEVRSALGNILPRAAGLRRVGLITYGPGPYNQCNVQLDLTPTPNAAGLIMRAVNSLIPAGKTPLTSAVEHAAKVLDYRKKPGTIVVVTDGEETCGRSPCELGKQLRATANRLTVHVIGYRIEGFSWIGEQSIAEVKCLAEQNKGLYVSTSTQDDLIDALEKTLGCPMVSEAALP